GLRKVRFFSFSLPFRHLSIDTAKFFSSPGLLQNARTGPFVPAFYFYPLCPTLLFFSLIIKITWEI
ncbi:MAG: hypothetical protein ACLFUN_01165, partial [Desulfobacterales bacterium]